MAHEVFGEAARRGGVVSCRALLRRNIPFKAHEPRQLRRAVALNSHLSGGPRTVSPVHSANSRVQVQLGSVLPAVCMQKPSKGTSRRQQTSLAADLARGILDPDLDAMRGAARWGSPSVSTTRMNGGTKWLWSWATELRSRFESCGPFADSLILESCERDGAEWLEKSPTPRLM